MKRKRTDINPFCATYSLTKVFVTITAEIAIALGHSKWLFVESCRRLKKPRHQLRKKFIFNFKLIAAGGALSKHDLEF
jgi:hypothetical protein